MKRSIPLVLAGLLLLASCGDDDSAATTTTTQAGEETTTTTTTTVPTTTTEESRLRPQTEDALRRCGQQQADLARDYSLGIMERGAFDEAADTCDAAMAQLETDIGGESALIGMGIALRASLLAQWQLDVAETGTALPAETGLTAEDAALNWERQFGEEIDALG